MCLSAKLCPRLASSCTLSQMACVVSLHLWPASQQGVAVLQRNDLRSDGKPCGLLLQDVIVGERRFQYEAEVKKNPLNYDSWFDYIRLEEVAGDYDKIREVCSGNIVKRLARCLFLLTRKCELTVRAG